MLRSMFTAISALNLHQVYMDVVANNLANVNTTGYKSSRVSFQDQFSQTMWDGSAPSDNLGGINPAQIGLGVRLGSISPNFNQGMLQSTGRNTDMAIQGDGFFIYNDAVTQFYSRDGSLELDAEGYLVNGATGQRIQGWMATVAGNTATVDTGAPIEGIELPLGTTLARKTGQTDLLGNLDATFDPADSYDVTVGVFDSLGVSHSVTVTFEHTDDNEWSWTASGTGVSGGSGTLTFDANGQYTGGTGDITIDASGGAEQTVFTLDLSQLTQLATDNDVSLSFQDGLPAGSFSTFFVTPATGEIYGVYSNGMQQLIGQLALASFVNPSGLTKVGQNMYQIGANSGEPGIGAAGTGGRGTVASGYLEGSNVDLGQEFTNMILAERGFQASSRVITTSDEMLLELVNIKR
jgi:flagellar hook protein FlgE